VPRDTIPVFHHLLDTYASETNKVVTVWREFTAAEMSFHLGYRSPLYGFTVVRIHAGRVIRNVNNLPDFRNVLSDNTFDALS
jgi:hypothetical protein